MSSSTGRRFTSSPRLRRRSTVTSKTASASGLALRASSNTAMAAGVFPRTTSSHARATRVDIDLAIAEDHVSLDVVDNGVGIQESELTAKKSLGLLGMHERAQLAGAHLEIVSAPGTGTRVEVAVTGTY